MRPVEIADTPHGVLPQVEEGHVHADADGNEFVMREKSCPTCGVSDQRVIGSRGGASHRYGRGVATRIVQCQRCRLMFPNPFPYPRNAQRLYGDPSKYFDAHDEGKKIEVGRALVRRLIRMLGGRTPSILDVGSGRGELLQGARLEGAADVVGLEFSDAMITYVRDRYGIALVPQTIETYAATQERVFDVIVLNAVLEHVYDPDAMMAGCAKLTRPGSLLYIDTPNEPSLLTMVGNAWNRLCLSEAVLNLSPTWMPYHVFGFNPKALRMLLDKHGFDVIHTRIHALPAIPASRDAGDRFRSFVGTQVCRVANATGTAANMYVWARRRGHTT